MQGDKIDKDLSLVRLTLGFMFALVVLPSNVKAIAILFFGLSVLFLSLRRKWSFNKEFFFTNSILYIVILVTLFYSENYSYGIYKLQTMSSLLVFPFVFSLFKINEIKQLFKHVTVYLSIYILGVFLLNTIPFLWYLMTHYSFKEIIIHYPKIIIIGIGKYSIHPIYMSLHCCVAIIFSLFVYKKANSKTLRILLIIINLILTSFLLIYARKGPILALFITLFIWTIFQNRKKYYIYTTIIVATVSLIIIMIPKTRGRFSELLTISSISTGNETSTNIRYTIYKSTKELIVESPLIGYGIGDYNDMLISKSKNKGHMSLSKNGYNSHNQYLSLLLIGGIPSFIIFLYMVIKNIIISWQNKNQVLILILTFYCISMLTENILERENGVIFFSLFINFFALKNLYESEKE